MRISEYLRQEYCVMDLKARDKRCAIQEIAKVLGKNKDLVDPKAFLHAVFKREALGSTGIGMGIAMPHCRTDAVREFVIGFGRSKKGIDFDSLDGKKAHFIFLMGASNRDLNMYLRLLAELSKVVIDADFKKKLMKAKTAKEVASLFAGGKKKL